MPVCVELCAGMGGMALGLAQAGYTHALLVERDARAAATLEANVFGPVLVQDAAEVDFTPYRGVDLVAGGVPCQPFSHGGLARGHEDERNLFEHAVRAVRECEPAAFLFENVAGLLRPAFAPYLESVTRRLGRLGYTVSTHLVDAADFGLPQRRKRCLLIGTRGKYAPPSPCGQFRTVRDLFRELGPPRASLPGHAPQTSVPRSYPGHTPSHLDKPAKTVVAGTGGSPGGANCVQLDDGTARHFTSRELACLQGFPATYRLPETRSHAVRQIGNAAPPPLIRAFAERL